MNKLVASIFIFLLGTMPVMANEYPTDETVHYVIKCMDELGGQSDENLYTCACRYDSIRTAMSYIDYDDALTYERNKKMPGEKGGAVRGNERAKGFYNKLVKARENANASCLVVKHVELKKPTNK